MEKIPLVILLASAALSQQSHAVLLAAWDFQTTTNGGTALLSAPNTPKVIFASHGQQDGTAAIYLDGTNGSSDWASTASNPQLTSFAGTTVNGSFTIASTTSPASLALANQSANGFHITFVFSTIGHEDIEVSYASQRTSSGFTGNQWAWSTDGTNFTNIGSPIVPASSFAAINLDLSSVDAIENQAAVYLRYTLNGATSATGNNRIDNIQIVPEPSAALLGLGSFGLLLRRRRA